MAEFASKGVAGAGLGLGIAGTALGLMNGGFGLLSGCNSGWNGHEIQGSSCGRGIERRR